MDTTERFDPRVLARLSEHCTQLSHHLDLLGNDLRQVHLGGSGPAAAPASSGAAVPAPAAGSLPGTLPGTVTAAVLARSGRVQAPPPLPPRGGPVRPSQVRPPQIGPPQIGPPQVGPPQVGPSQIGPSQIGPPGRPMVPPDARPIVPPPTGPMVPPHAGRAAPPAAPWQRPIPPTRYATPPPRLVNPPPPGGLFGWRERWGREGLVSRLLAVAGIGVTLIGLVMMLVLAAQAGWLQPGVRVAGGVVLAAALVAAGARVAGRPGGRVGGVALAGTGLAAAFLDVVAMTTVYHWLTPVAGLALAAAVTAGGALLALRWDSQPLAVTVIVATWLTAPLVSPALDLLLVGFFVLVQVAGAVVDLQRRWPAIAVVRTLPVVVALVALTVREGLGGGLEWTVILVSVLVTLIGMHGGVLAARAGSHPVTTAVAAGLAAVPVLVAGLFDGPPRAALVPWLVAAALWPVYLVRRRIGAPIDLVVVSVAAISMLRGAIAIPAVDPVLEVVPVLVIAVVAGAVCLREPSKVMLGVAGSFTAIGLLWAVGVVPPEVLADRVRGPQVLGAGALTAGLLVLALVALWLVIARRTSVLAARPALVALGGVGVGVYGLTMACVATPLTATGGGFTTGHFLATIAWVLVGSALLLLGLSRPAMVQVSMVAGLSILAAATAKLVFFDLSALGGLTRASTFLVAGLVLLAAGTRYARAVGEVLATDRSSAATGAGTGAGTGSGTGAGAGAGAGAGGPV